jgi:hypothetical protein
MSRGFRLNRNLKGAQSTAEARTEEVKKAEKIGRQGIRS